jgi:hypothetical protein
MKTTMKKTYLQPSMAMDIMITESMICGSVTSDNGIGYGGVDEDGIIDPASRRCHNVWEEELEEEGYEDY